MEEIIKTCTIISVPTDRRDEAIEHAIDVNPANDPLFTLDDDLGDIEGVSDTRKLWPNGSTLRVCFLEGDPVVHERIKPIVQQWSEFANLKFEFVDSMDAHIRVSFDPQGGSWSYVGTDSTLVWLLSQPTMNYGWLTPETQEIEYRRVVLHEFGHAIGLIHEHLSPESTIPWNEAAVIDYYRETNRWDEATTRHNVLSPAVADAVTRFDPNSIMLYPVPGHLTVGDFAIPWSNSALSDLDKTFVASLYPFG